ncbi:hypothetical protein QYE76_029260 [Lolium multiflorum]|uniref:Uncharacterized protein n=1 Tax=Lolium multiflorum TaxID=4521 RepID=A0AAD8QNB1_LOLMU|nr:hypothetical protein QYE76_029260 [Lolium multiflorum]
MASQEQLEEHYNRHFFRTEEDAEAAGVGGDEDHEMEDAAGGSADEPSGDEASGAAGGSTYEPSGDEATGATGGGGETSGDDPSGAAGSSGTGTSGSKRPRKARRQNTVATGRDTIKEVDPASGLPVEPKDVAKGYGNQLACILREVVNLNETDLRAENKAHLRAQLIARLHSRYKFLGDYASTHETKNIVNSQALLKFTKHLSSYKYMVRKLIADGKGFEEVHSAFPHVSQADFDAFVANEELQATKNRKLWGKEMRELNIGNHNLGSRGYEGKEPYWAKEDEAYINAGIENPWLKYKDPLERRFIRSRYHKKKLTGELVTDPKVVTDIIWFTNDKKVLALEKKLEEERQRLSQCDEGSSSQASMGRVAWDKPLALSTPCTFLMKVNDELKDVARGSILRPLDKKWHTRDMEDDVYRVEVDRALPGYEDLFPPNQPHGADDDSPLNLASLKGWVLLWPKTLIRINTYSGSTASKGKHIAAPQPAAPVVSAPPQQPAASVVNAPPQQPVAPEVSAPPQLTAAPDVEAYDRDDFQWEIPTSSQVARFNDIFNVFRMRMLHFTAVRLVALSLSSQIVKEGTLTITIMDPFYMRESIICNAGDQAIATKQVEDFMLANIKKGAILIPYFPEDKFCTLIVVHPQHSHAIYLDSGRDKKKDYAHIKALLNDALTGFANKAGPLKVERKSRGGLVLTHTTNFPCLRQSTEDNGMDAWYAILQMQEYIKSGAFFYGYGLPPNEEIDLRLVMSRDERPFNSLEGCRPFPPKQMPTTYVVYKGRVPGVYDDWEDCRRQVHRFSGNNYKGYPTRVEAEGRYARYLAGERRDMRRNRMKTMAFVMMLIVTMLVMFYVIVV